jgi:hypothetical protein
MLNYAIINDAETNNNVAVIAHDYDKGRLLFKAKNQYISDLLKILFDRKFYRIEEDDDIEYKEEVGKFDEDLLEIALPTLEKYIVDEFWENEEENIDDLVEEKFNKLILPKN